MTTIAITGASGKLGRATLGYLMKRGVAPLSVVPVVRDLTKARDLNAPGSQVRYGDYTDPASLESAFSRVDTLLFISSSSLGEERVLHHANVVNAARKQPQTVTKHGKEAVVVLDAEEYKRLKRIERKKKPTLAEWLLAIPQGGPDEDIFERMSYTPRDIDL